MAGKYNIHLYDRLSEDSKAIIDLIWPNGDYPKGSSLGKSAKARGMDLDAYLFWRFNSPKPTSGTGRGRRVMSEEGKKHLSEYWKGRKKSEEHTVRIREAKAGAKNPRYGVKSSNETIEKYKEAVKGRGFLGTPSAVVRWWKYKKGNEEVVWGELSKETIDEITRMWNEEVRPLISQEDIDRSSAEYRVWRREVLRRDNFTCQKTGVKGGKLQVHHIWPFHLMPEYRFSTFNGITLSKGAHKEFHSKYGWKENTMTQIQEFLGRKLPEEQFNMFEIEYGYMMYDYFQGLSEYEDD